MIQKFFYPCKKVWGLEEGVGVGWASFLKSTAPPCLSTLNFFYTQRDKNSYILIPNEKFLGFGQKTKVSLIIAAMLETCTWILRKPNGTIRGRFSDSEKGKIDDLKKSFLDSSLKKKLLRSNRIRTKLDIFKK